jgi:hypothetical protein
MMCYNYDMVVTSDRGPKQKERERHRDSAERADAGASVFLFLAAASRLPFIAVIWADVGACCWESGVSLSLDNQHEKEE